GEAGLVEPAGQRRRGIELGRDLAAGAALAHDATLGARAERELPRVDQDGLAGARLAGEHGEAGAELEFERIDDDEVFQRQAAQHDAGREDALRWSEGAGQGARRVEPRMVPARGLMP